MKFTVNASRQLLSVLAFSICIAFAGAAHSSSLEPEDTRHLLRNIATRVRVQTDTRVLIGGFVITGTAPKDVIVRAIGPSLTVNGAPLVGRLADPTIELFAEGNTVPIATNDNWKETQQGAIAATGVPPTNDFESAIVRTLNPGSYTAVMRGKNNTSGIGVVEVYDLGTTRDPKLANISSRGHTGIGDDVLIGGIITSGGASATAIIDVVVRAIGPSLAARGVADPLADPTLTLVDGNGSLVAFNDNWEDDQPLQIQESGLGPTHPSESAIVASLAAGNYTAVVRGANGTTGIALVEFYDDARSSAPTN